MTTDLVHMGVSSHDLTDAPGVGPFFVDARSSTDPTGTLKIRRGLHSALDMRLRQLKARLRAAVIDIDILGLGANMAAMGMAGDARLASFTKLLETMTAQALAGDWLAAKIARTWVEAREMAGREAGRAVSSPMPGNAVTEAQVELGALEDALALLATRAAAGAIHTQLRPARAWANIAAAFDSAVDNRAVAFANSVIVATHLHSKVAAYRQAGISQVGVSAERQPGIRPSQRGRASDSAPSMMGDRQTSPSRTPPRLAAPDLTSPNLDRLTATSTSLRTVSETPQVPPSYDGRPVTDGTDNDFTQDRPRPDPEGPSPEEIARRRAHYGAAPEETSHPEWERRRAEGDDDEALVGVITAGDDRVCQECEDIEASGPYDLDEVLDLLPAHPNCRCSVFPWFDKRFAGDTLPPLLALHHIVPEANQQNLGFQVPLGGKGKRLKRLRRRFKMIDFAPDQPRDDHGRWTAGGTSWSPEGFVSPNIGVGNLSFMEAQVALNSNRQRALEQASHEIDGALELHSVEAAAIGCWADGAENSLAISMPGATPAEARVSMAMKAYLADQKAALVFVPGVGQKDFIASFSANGALDDIHRQLLQDGVSFHTLIPGNNSAIVHVYGTDQATLDTVGKAAERYGSEVAVTHGSGEFIGTKLETGTDREQRDDARRAYETVIRGAAAASELQGRNVGAIWHDIRDRWDQTLAEIRDAFNPDQPRDPDGKWTGGGGVTSSIGEQHERETGRGRGQRGGSHSLEQAQTAATLAAAGRSPLTGLPNKPVQFKTDGSWYVPGPIARLHDAAEAYTHAAGIPYDPPRQYAKLDKDRATKIGASFEEMKHEPDDPAVKASYEALAKETLAQWQALKATGLQVEWIKPGQADPYAENPRLGAQDISLNNHWWGFPTDLGFGSGEELHSNPMLAPTDEVIDGRKCVVNDIFRIVHDMFGHFKEGVGFRAAGEENAWRVHSSMFSDLARGAMTSETRGQNSWVNYGPYGEFNRTASAVDTHYAPQKVGLMPAWTWNEGRHDVKDATGLLRLLDQWMNEDRWLGDYNPDQPRVPAGSPEGGQFGSAGGEHYDPFTNTWTKEPTPTMHLDPKVAVVGGDRWNQKTALRLELEYERSKPALEKLANDVVGGIVSIPQGEDDEEEEQPFVPDSWDGMSSDLQSKAEDEWMSSTSSDFYDSEVSNWQESGDAMDDATHQVVSEWDDHPKTKYPPPGQHGTPGKFQPTVEEWPDWAQQALDGVREDRKENGKSDIPYTDSQIFHAISISYDGGNGGWGYNDKYGPDIEIDHDALGVPSGWEEGGHTDPVFPGFEPEKPTDRFNDEMHNEVHDALFDALKSEAESKSSDIDPPEYLKDNLQEQQGEYWDQMSDEEKFNWTEKNTSLIDDLEKSSGSGGSEVGVPQVVTMPIHFDPLGPAKGDDPGPNYKTTQALARRMSIDRAVQVMESRGVTASVSLKNVAMEIDNKLWKDWKGSSTSEGGQLLQLAIAEELGGRLNVEQLGTKEISAVAAAKAMKRLRNNASSEFYGGYDAVKAYIRAKWEVAQFLLDRADMQTVDLYRSVGVNLDKEKIEEVSVKSPPLPGEVEHGVEAWTDFKRVPDVVVTRNGAASWSIDPKIVNEWSGALKLRAQVPRTAVVSVPAFGQNIYTEREVVVAGTAWKGWDAWKDTAPPFERAPLQGVGA